MLDRPASGAGDRPGAPPQRVALFAAILGAIVGLGVVGCGGGGGGSTQRQAGTAPSGPGAGLSQPATATATSSAVTGGASEEGRVRKAIVGVLASGGAADACGRFVTGNYIRAAFGDHRGCVQAQAPGSLARSVRIIGIYVNESAATASAIAVPAGGPSDGERIKVALVLDGGVWRVDSLRSNAPVGP